MRYFNERNEVVENYALALFEVAKESNKDLNEIKNDLVEFYSALKHDELKELRKVLYYPLISVEEKIASIHEAFDGNIDELVIDFIVTLTQEQRLNFFSLIIEEFKMIYRISSDVVQVKAKFGIEPTQDEVNKIITTMKEKLKCADIEFEYIVDSELIGGVKLFFNGKFIDNTLASKIKRYAKQIRA